VNRLASYEAGSPLAIVDPRGTSSECPKCGAEMIENGYRRLRCPSCGYEADRDVVGKLNIRKRALKMLGIKIDFGGSLTTPTAPQMTDVSPNRWGESGRSEIPPRSLSSRAPDSKNIMTRK